MGYKYENVKAEVLRSRIFLILLQYIGNVLIADHEPEVFRFSRTKQDYGIGDRVVFHILGGFLRWDAQYFVHISIYGYTYENTLAFFPFLPIIIGVTGKILHYFFPFLSIEAVVLLLYIALNIIIFHLAAVALYKLTCLIFNDVTMSRKAVLLFCYNPASIFFIAPYTECLYSLFTFRVMLSCLMLYQKYEKCALKFSLKDGKVIIETILSILTRSNGVMNIGFILFTFTCLMIKTLPSSPLLFKFAYFLKYLSITFFYVTVSLVPLILYQVYCYKRFCTDFYIELPNNVREYGISQNYVLPGEFSSHNQSWCYNKIPEAYSYVQDHYWNVGLFRYYEIKQIPNFILAAPIIIILLKNYIRHLFKNFDKNVLKIFVLDHKLDRPKQMRISIVDPLLNVFVIHALVLTVFCVLIIHIQVSTRMLCSASPVLYWYCSQYLDYSSDQKLKKIFLWSYTSRSELSVKVYFYSYFIIGTILFCNFLPWT